MNRSGMEEDKPRQLVNLFKALTHPARLAILDALRSSEECVCHLEARLGYRQAYISQQLAVLREAGIVADERDGWNIYYRVVRPEVFTLIDIARLMVGIQPDSSQRPARSADCPCPKCTSVARKT
jgi:DNA-binding transcriptional ArsR family regulator